MHFEGTLWELGLKDYKIFAKIQKTVNFVIFLKNSTDICGNFGFSSVEETLLVLNWHIVVF